MHIKNQEELTYTVFLFHFSVVLWIRIEQARFPKSEQKESKNPPTLSTNPRFTDSTAEVQSLIG